MLDIKSYPKEMQIKISRTNIDYFFSKLNIETQNELVDYVIQEEKISILSEEQIRKNYEKIKQLIIKKPFLIGQSKLHGQDLDLITALIHLDDKKALECVEALTDTNTVYLRNLIQSKKDLLNFLRGDVDVAIKLIVNNFQLIKFVRFSEEFGYKLIHALAQAKMPDRKITQKIDIINNLLLKKDMIFLNMYLEKYIARMTKKRKNAIFCNLFAVLNIHDTDCDIAITLLSSVNFRSGDSVKICEKALEHQLTELSTFNAMPIAKKIKAISQRCNTTNQQHKVTELIQNSFSSLSKKHIKSNLKQITKHSNKKNAKELLIRIISVSILDAFSGYTLSKNGMKINETERALAINTALKEKQNIILDMQIIYDEFMKAQTLSDMLQSIEKYLKVLLFYIYDTPKNSFYLKNNAFAFAAFFVLFFLSFDVDKFLTPNTEYFKLVLEMVATISD